MTEDARFEDGGERPLNLGALDAGDLEVISSLVQDAVLPVTEIRWQASKRRVGLLVNRIRWEDVEAARARGRPVERVQSLLVIDNVLGMASQGVDRSDRDMILQLMSVTFEPGEDAEGFVVLTLAGDGALRAKVEALEVALRDVTRPYLAPSGKLPDHGA
ncbi:MULTISPECIES: DUF2948 family protein [Mameliella]|uniref:DUF2948 domain-containing protein n=1 Tax=Mameliella alba TaxID=561184 RepID=A0A0B3SCR0_9RHOB|nr:MULTISPECIES: DUF2948 family protein [Mameliella]ODM49088.1 hypothetical protein A9320_17630 [Ruegeria sp. PBVC088]KHQ54481.1 hypothetical protein OA50_01075 [Mameliella alba]MBY6118363.1 DUF2948 family protein [Mameliella alba]MDD9730432.1 DUF2948 family protein [Mameliella sp. AT18]OWV43359.1 hypothetical protein CDZ95_11290 [Mameliella alba]